MLTEERQAKIIEILNREKSVTVQSLMKELDTSESTIRRDLVALDKSGDLTKVHGGAILKSGVYNMKDDEVVLRQEQNADEKDKIAKYAASLICENDFVYVDAGTTTERMIDYITAKKVVFVTNAISHAKKLSERGYVVHLLGGEFKAITEAIVGEMALRTLDMYTFTRGFWGANAVDFERGFSTPEIREAMVKTKSMEHCKACYVLADSSKFGQMSCVKFASYDQAIIITTKVNDIPEGKGENIINII